MLWGVIIAVAEDNGVLSRIRPQFMNNTFLRRTLLPAIIILICWLVAGGHSRYSVGIVAILSGVLVWFASYKQGYLFKHADTFGAPSHGLAPGRMGYTCYTSSASSLFMNYSIAFMDPMKRLAMLKPLLCLALVWRSRLLSAKLLIQRSSARSQISGEGKLNRSSFPFKMVHSKLMVLSTQ